MSWWNVALVVVGVLLGLLGAFWMLQGADLVHVQPILCLSDCRPVLHGSLGWLITGIVTVIVGLLCVVAGSKYRRRPA